MVPLTIFNLTIAFVAGFLTFFAGCLAPIAPVYIGFLAGSAPKGLDPKYKKLFTQNALIFTAGFLTVFLLEIDFPGVFLLEIAITNHPVYLIKKS